MTTLLVTKKIIISGKIAVTMIVLIIIDKKKQTVNRLINNLLTSLLDLQKFFTLLFDSPQFQILFVFLLFTFAA